MGVSQQQNHRIIMTHHNNKTAAPCGWTCSGEAYGWHPSVKSHQPSAVSAMPEAERGKEQIDTMRSFANKQTARQKQSLLSRILPELIWVTIIAIIFMTIRPPFPKGYQLQRCSGENPETSRSRPMWKVELRCLHPLTVDKKRLRPESGGGPECWSVVKTIPLEAIHTSRNERNEYTLGRWFLALT